MRLPCPRLAGHFGAAASAGPAGLAGLAVLVVLAVLAVLTVLAPVRPAAAAGSCAPPVIAHRGEPSVAPENTLASFRAALDHGARTIELDVRFTSSDVPVVLHDRTVDRTTNGTGEVTTMTFTKLRSLDAGSWYGSAFTGEKVPTLYEVLNLAKSRGARAVVELKVTPTSTELTKFLDRINRLGMQGSVVVQSFRPTAITKVRAAAPTLRTGIIDQSTARTSEDIKQYGRTYTNSYTQATVERVNTWTAAGISVYAFTANSPAQWHPYAGSVLAGMVTDRTRDYLAWAAAGCPAS